MKLQCTIFCLLLSMGLFAQKKQEFSYIPFTEKPRTQVFRCNIFPALGSHLFLAWEKSFQKDKSVEIGLDMIGILQKEREMFPNGFLGHIGLRSYRLKKDDGEVYLPMNGTYFHALVKGGSSRCFENFVAKDANGNTSNSKEIITNTHALLLFGVGRQYILFNRFSLDMNLAMGCLFETGNPVKGTGISFTSSNAPFIYGFLRLDPSLPLAASASVRIGYVFGRNKRN